MQSNAQKQQNWWQSLSPDWKRAFNEVFLKSENNTDIPPAETLELIWTAPAIRFAGPSAPYPNMSFELSDISGLTGLKQLQIVVVIHHQLSDLSGITALKNLKSLFVLNNRISSLDDLETLTDMEELYCQNNFIRSLLPLRNLSKLRTIYCCDNQLTSLEGIGEQHTTALEKFACLPNKGIPHPDIVRFELSVGIKCQRG